MSLLTTDIVYTNIDQKLVNSLHRLYTNIGQKLMNSLHGLYTNIDQKLMNSLHRLYTNIDQKLMNSLHGLLNCEIGGLGCRVITTEYRTRVHCIHM